LLDPRQIRRRMLDEHTRLAGWLAELEHLAGRLRRGEKAVLPELRRRAEGLRVFFLGHLALEERFLAPALARAGPEGAKRAHRLLDDHEAQRAEIERFARGVSAAWPSEIALADAVESFVRSVRDDMRREEDLDLDPGLLMDPDA
jgi:hypothetical protein